MKRFLKTLILCVSVLALVLTAFACGETEGDETKGLKLTKYIGDDFYTVSGYVGEENVTKLNLADEATKLSEEKGHEVVIGRIKTNAFSGNDTLTELIVPETVETIDEGAFAGMRKLKKLTIPFVGASVNADSSFNQSASSGDKVVDAQRTFAYMFGSESYDFGAMVTQSYDANNTITKYLPLSLEEVTVSPKANYELPMYAFAGNNLVTKINLTNKVTVIGEYAFKNCSNLNTITDGEKVALPESVKEIKAGAFSGCVALKDYNKDAKTGFSFSAGNNLKKIGSNAFESAALSIINIPASVEEIGSRCFKLSAVKEITLPAIAEIADYAFYGCEELVKVNVDLTKITTIGDFAFANCSLLKYVGASGCAEGIVNIGADKVQPNAFYETDMQLA